MKANFVRAYNPRNVIGVNNISQRNFRNTPAFVNWICNVFIPDYYETLDTDEICFEFSKEKKLPENRGNILPNKMYWEIVDIFGEVKESSKAYINFNPSQVLELMEKKCNIKFSEPD